MNLYEIEVLLELATRHKDLSRAEELIVEHVRNELEKAQQETDSGQKPVTRES